MDIQLLVDNIVGALINWPLFIFVIGASIICTVAFNFIQVRYFGFACKNILAPVQSEDTQQTKVDMTPIQAFINTLSTNLGNGAVAGVAVAVFAGGPGSAFWLVIFGILLMAVRFAEVFLSMYYANQSQGAKLGGPMLYLSFVPGGSFLRWIYGLSCLLFGFIAGSTVQTNSITVSIIDTVKGSSLEPFITPWGCAIVLTLFTAYVVFGGAARIVKLSEAIVPIKVIVFFTSAILILGYHYQSIGHALSLIIEGAFRPEALMGGILGFTIQQAVRLGMMHAIFATESGLGTAAILFGHTGSKTPVKDGILAMLSTFISTLVCFIVALCIIASGVWNSGLNSTALTGAAFKTVFGAAGGWVVTFLSASFGIGVIVGYAYITREAWLFITKGRFSLAFALLYCLAALCGAILEVSTVWKASDIFMAFMLITNLLGILYLVPVIRKNVQAFAVGK